jgi:hypothetical protein
MQNKPNFPPFRPKNEDFTQKQSQFKANSNPILAQKQGWQTQTNPIFAQKLGGKPKTKPISTRNFRPAKGKIFGKSARKNNFKFFLSQNHRIEHYITRTMENLIIFEVLK